MLMWANNFRLVFWVAVVPGALAVLLLLLGVHDPHREHPHQRENPLRLENLKQLGAGYWWVVGIGCIFTLARFSEAFLVLYAQKRGVKLALVPLVMVAMNVVYSLSAYPFGRMSDTMSHRGLLAVGLATLILADIVLASSTGWRGVLLGVTIWGVHMGMTQGLLSRMVADTSPSNLRGTAFGFFNLFSGGAILVASILAGLVWDKIGPSYTFVAGAIFCGAALLPLLKSTTRTLPPGSAHLP
jgi:predicted MFS family arabinose efflux permease